MVEKEFAYIGKLAEAGVVEARAEATRLLKESDGSLPGGVGKRVAA